MSIQLPIYLDYHATTPIDKRVLDAMLPFFTEHFGNAASLQHRFGWIAKEAIDGSRQTIANIINAQPREIIFTSGATESNNLSIKGVCDALKWKGNHIVTTAIEHASVIDVCRVMQLQGFDVTVVPVDATGRVDAENIRRAITEKTILVSVMMANNEIGTIQPAKEIAKMCAERDLLFHTDATQCVGKLPVDVLAMNIHLMSFTAHKLYGPKGVGALYIRSKNPRVKLTAQMDGGGQENGMRSGTMNVPSIVGFGKALEIANNEMSEDANRISVLRDYLQTKIELLGDVKINGNHSNRLYNNLNVTIQGVSAEMLTTSLGDVAISSGAACATQERTSYHGSHILQAIGCSKEDARSTVRFGLGRFTTKEEIDYVVEKLNNVVPELRTQSLYLA